MVLAAMSATSTWTGLWSCWKTRSKEAVLMRDVAEEAIEEVADELDLRVRKAS